MAADLEKALDALEEKLDVQQLEMTVEFFASLKTERYEASALEAVRDAFERAGNVLEDPQSQAEINQIARELNQKILSLRYKPSKDLLENLNK